MVRNHNHFRGLHGIIWIDSLGETPKQGREGLYMHMCGGVVVTMQALIPAPAAAWISLELGMRLVDMPRKQRRLLEAGNDMDEWA